MRSSGSIALFLAIACFVSRMLMGDEAFAEVAGRYENKAYAYAVIIPDGLKGYKPAPPAPVHGILIRLAAESDSRIEVDASYNTLEYRSVREASVGDTEWFVKRCGGSWRAESDPTTLGSLPALHIKITCIQGGGNSSHTVLDGVIAIRQTPANQMLGVIYSVTLETTEQRYADDKKVYEQILRSFKLSEG